MPVKSRYTLRISPIYFLTICLSNCKANRTSDRDERALRRGRNQVDPCVDLRSAGANEAEAHHRRSARSAYLNSEHQSRRAIGIRSLTNTHLRCSYTRLTRRSVFDLHSGRPVTCTICKTETLILSIGVYFVCCMFRSCSKVYSQFFSPRV